MNTANPLFEASRRLKLKEVESPALAEQTQDQDDDLASQKIDLQNIIQLKEAFDEADLDRGGKLEKPEFLESFGRILKDSMTRKQLNQLFMKIDANSDGGVEWDEFMSYILSENQTLSLMKAENFDYVKSNPDEHTLIRENCHDDMITKILAIPDINDKKKISQYITCSKDGGVKFFNMKYECTNTLKISKFHINAIAYFQRSNILAAATDDEKIQFFDLNLAKYFMGIPVGKMSEMECNFLSLDAYYFSDKYLERLVAGDSKGVLHIFDFKPDWHICNDDLKCHEDQLEKAKDLEIELKKKKLKDDPTIIHKWKKLDDKNFYKVPKKHIIKNVDIRKLSIHKKEITNIKYIEDLLSIVSSGSDGTFHFHDYVELTLKRSFKAHKKAIKSFVWASKYKLIASVDEERHIILWNPYTCDVVNFLFGHVSPIQSLAVHEERHQLISLGTDKMIKIWDLRDSRCLKTYIDKTRYRPEDYLTNVVVEAENDRLIFTSKNLNIWNFKTLYQVHDTSHEAKVHFAFFNSQFDYIISGDDKSNVTLWNVRNGKVKFKFNSKTNGAKVVCATLDEPQRRLITGDTKGNIDIINFNNGMKLQSFETLEKCEISALLHTSKSDRDGMHRIIAGGWEKKIYTFRDDTQAAKHEKIFGAPNESHNKDITCLAFSKKHRLLISGSEDGSLRLWNADFGYLLKQIDELDKTCVTAENNTLNCVEHIITIDDADLFLTFTSNQLMRVWQIKPIKKLFKICLNHHVKETLIGANISSDSKDLISYDSGGYYKLWDISGLLFNPIKKNVVEKLFIRAHKSSINYAEIFIFDPLSHDEEGSVRSQADLGVNYEDNLSNTNEKTSKNVRFVTPSKISRKIPENLELDKTRLSILPPLNNTLPYKEKYKKDKYIVTCSSDQNVQLFTIHGISIGLFGINEWIIENSSTFRKAAARKGTPEPVRDIVDEEEDEKKDIPQSALIPKKVVFKRAEEGKKSEKTPKKLANISPLPIRKFTDSSDIFTRKHTAQISEEERDEKDDTDDIKGVDTSNNLSKSKIDESNVDELFNDIIEKSKFDLHTMNRKREVTPSQNLAQYLIRYGSKNLDHEKHLPAKFPSSNQEMLEFIRQFNSVDPKGKIETIYRKMPALRQSKKKF